ncbi:MAG: TolC family protein [Desulfohalobiaceae bacterium]|nr:TolC family protein [Desulfohalobiaceae bacterium]
MRKKRLDPIHILWLIPLLLWPAGGCAPVDRWDLFRPDFEESVREEALEPLDSAGRFQPEMTQRPEFDLPPPGQPLDLSIEETTILALRNNRELRVQQLNPVITGTFERIERGVFDPELFAEFRYAEETASEISRATGEQFSVESSETLAEAGIRQDLPSGTTLEASLEQDRNQSNRAPNQRRARAGLSITQSLLEGFGAAVNLVSVRQAELDTLASIYQLRGFTEALVAETEIAYWNYVLALQEIAIFESSLDIARQQRDEVEQQIEVGLLPETEAAATRAEVARREQDLIDARSLMEERRLRLLRLINPGETGQLDRRFQPKSDPMIVPEPLENLGERLTLAERSRPDLAEARLRRRQGRLETIVTRNGLLPKLDLFIDLGRTGYADSFSASFQNLDEDTYDFSTGLRLSHFLRNRTAEARHEAARATHHQTVEAVDNLRQILRLDVRLAVNEVERSRQQITASKVTRRFAEQTADAEKERFDVGASTALLVAQAQRDLLAARIEEVRAIINYRIALVDLYLSEGSLLQRRGVSLGEANYASRKYKKD